MMYIYISEFNLYFYKRLLLSFIEHTETSEPSYIYGKELELNANIALKI